MTLRERTWVASATELAHALGIADPAEAAALHAASAGHVVLAGAARSAARDQELLPLLESSDFADYVAARLAAEISPCPRDTGLEPGDLEVAGVLAHLGRFPAGILGPVIDVLASAGADSPEPAAVLLRLRVESVVTEAGPPGTLHVPPLLAGLLRRGVPDDEVVRDRLRALTRVVITGLVRGSEVAPDPRLVDLALRVARRTRSWDLLDELVDVAGLQLFLLAPVSACAAFAGLPAEVLRAAPDLAGMATFAEVVAPHVAALGSVPGETSLEVLVAASTDRGIVDLWESLVRDRGARDGTRVPIPDPSSPVERGGAGPEEGIDAPVSPAARDHGFCAGLEHMNAALGRGDLAAALERGRLVHEESRRTGTSLVITAAILALLAGDSRSAWVSLYGAVDRVREGHVPGDCLLPAAEAWTNLVAVDTGDGVPGVRTTGPTLFPALVRPPDLLATGVAALDGLDVAEAERVIGLLTAEPRLGPAGILLPVLRRTCALLSARSEAEILLVEDEVDLDDVHVHGIPGTHTLLDAGRASVLLALGRVFRAERIIVDLPGYTPLKGILAARLALVSGRPEAAVSEVRALQYATNLSAKQRAELALVHVVALLRLERIDEARKHMDVALGLVRHCRSLLPLASIPLPDRRVLCSFLDAEAWAAVHTAVPGLDVAADGLEDLVLSVGTLAVAEARAPDMGEREVDLLALLDSGASIAEIAEIVSQAEGTVKNRLSVVYRKLGVSDRHAAVELGRAWGFLDVE